MIYLGIVVALVALVLTICLGIVSNHADAAFYEKEARFRRYAGQNDRESDASFLRREQKLELRDKWGEDE